MYFEMCDLQLSAILKSEFYNEIKINCIIISMQTCSRMVLVSLFVDFQHNYSCMLEKEEQKFNIVHFLCECFKVKNACPETCSPCMVKATALN